MKILKKILFVFFLLFPISNSYGEMVTHVQTNTFLDGPHTSGSDEDNDNDKQSRQIQGIHFNDDGTKLFTTYAQKPVLDGTRDTFQYVHEYNLSTPYDISTRTYAGNDERCELGSGSDGHSGNAAHDLEFSNDGMKLFTSDKTTDMLFRFDLTSPYDVSTCSFVYETTTVDTPALQNGSNAGTKGTNTRLQGFEISEDGKKLFLLFHDSGGDPSRLHEYNLSTPFDLRTLSLVTSAGIKLPSAHVANPNTMRFNNVGNRIFIVSHNTATLSVTQVSLNSPYDTSQFTVDGSIKLTDIAGAEGLSQPRGISFSRSGLKMYVGHDTTSSIFEFNLVCPFNIISGKCPPITENSDRTGIAEAQVELANRTIDLSTKSVLNRLKWIRRNKDKQNLSNQNIKLNFSNSLISSLSELPISSFKKISTTKNNVQSNKNYFYWSEGGISIGKIGDTNIASSKEINVKSLTFGFDKFKDDYGIEGFALRFGGDDLDVGNSGSNLDSKTYNLTYYSTTPIKDDTKFIDKIFGIGKIRSDIITVLDGSNRTADRTGNQMFGTFKLKDEIKKNNLILVPSAQFDFGHTILNGYKESGTGAIIVEDQHVRTKNLRATIAVFEDLSTDKYEFKRHGKLEYLADVDRSSDFKYRYVSDRDTSFSETLHTGALHNINAEVGLDIVFSNNYSIFVIYERNQAIDYGHTDNLYIALGYLPYEGAEYAFTINGSENLLSNLEFKKNVNGLNLSFNVKDDITNLGDNREANIVLNKVF